MKPPPLIQDAVSKLCTRFEAGGYAMTPVIDIGALVANADGTVDEKELEILHYLFDALLGSALSCLAFGEPFAPLRDGLPFARSFALRRTRSAGLPSLCNK